MRESGRFSGGRSKKTIMSGVNIKGAFSARKGIVTAMKKLVFCSAIVSLLLGCIFAAVYKIHSGGVWFSLSVTFFCTFYHIAMRLAVGAAANKMKIQVKRIKLTKAESTFYKKIGIKRWKSFMPTYDKALFDIKKRTLTELYINMSVSLKGHGVMAVLSFLPIFVSGRLGGFYAFLITSVLAALFDLALVCVQRYNLSRISRIL